MLLTCLQEKSGTFGLRIYEELKTLSQKFGNVFVAAIMSGKLQKESYKHFLDNVIQPHVKKDNFMLILESWGGQTNPALYSKKFLDGNNELTCSLNIISQKCTSLCQPCNVYFSRQVKC
jgi:hypothetical protein